jgi:hypothetical protein
MMKVRKGYKVTNSEMKCRDFQFKLNKWFHVKGDVVPCQNGFHWCIKADDCFNYYDFDSNNRVFEVEVKGSTVNNDDKSCSRSIRLVRELSWHEVLELVNTGANNAGRGNSGDKNSGDWNSGSRNSGDRNSGPSNSGYRNSGSRNSGSSNSGSRNSGDWNSGSRNSGDWNSCNYETGFFNSKQSDMINVFNKPCKRKDWDNAPKPEFIYISLTTWIDGWNMTDEEKANNPDWEVREGYLKTLSYKEAWVDAYKKATQKDIKLLKALPNFDADVFEEITGIRVD